MNKSPSKIKTARLCGRKFYGVYVEKWDTGPKPAADFGTDVHALLEHYLGSGELPSSAVDLDWQSDDKERATHVALAAIPHLPMPPVPDLELEGWARIPLSDGTIMLGRVDMWEPNLHRVTDFKTTSNFKYSLSEEQLRIDPQSITYAYSRIGTGNTITVRFLYLRTRAPYYTKEVEVFYTRSELQDAWAKMVANDVANIDGIITAESFADVEPDLSACGAFGGCPFRTKCAALGDASMGVFSSLFSTKQDGEKKEMTGLRRIKVRELKPLDAPVIKQAAEVADKVLSTPAGEEPGWWDTAKEAGLLKEEDQPVEATAINPPEEETPPAKEVVYLEPTGPVTKWTKSQLVGWLGYNKPGYFSEIPANKHRVPQLREDVATLRRQLKEGEALTDDEILQDRPAIPEPTKTQVAAPKQTVKKETVKKEPRKEAATGYRLYINCAPSGPYKRLEQILEPVFEEVDQSRQKNEGAQGHYLTIPYGQGPARVAASLLKLRKDLSGAIVIDRRTPVAPSAIEVLAPRAIQIITGF
jgi:RecB family exonuclease